MDEQIKAFNEVLNIYYELLEVVGTAPSLWNLANNQAIRQFPTDVEFVADVEDIILNNLSKHEMWLVREYFSCQDFLDGVQKVQFNNICARLGQIFINKKIYPTSKYNKSSIN